MCKYCNKLAELRNEERKLYSDVLAKYKKELHSDEKLFKRILMFLEFFEENYDVPRDMESEFCSIIWEIERILKGGDKNEED